jgi:hypothetical protein
MHRSVEITLNENSSAGKPPRKFAAQTCDIEYGRTHYEPSVDSPPSPARQPTKVVWHEGNAEMFGQRNAAGMLPVTDVKILASDGALLIDDWPLCTNRDVPRNLDNDGVVFFVLQPD